jgi:NitT/TauT family transport system substrate-binding protein
LKRSYILAVIVGLIIASLAGTLFYQNLTVPSTLETVTVGHVPVESFALLYIAQQQGYFTNHGLNVSIADYATGTVAVQALTSSTVDIAGSSEYVVAYNAIERQNISIIASLGEAQIWI